MQRAEQIYRLYLLQSVCYGAIFIKKITNLKEFNMTFRFFHYVFYKASPASRTSTLICCVVLTSFFLSPAHSWADDLQKFDLNINELKQRSNSRPAGSHNQPISRKNVLSAKGEQSIGFPPNKTRKSKDTSRTNREYSNPERAVIKVRSQEKLLLLKSLPSPGLIPTPSPAKTVKIQTALQPCELVPKILVDFLSPIPTAEALSGVRMEGFYAVRGNMITAAISCGLDHNEEATFSRQLAAHGTRLINITNSDSLETVVNKIAGTLGFSTQTVRATLDNARLVYIFPAGSKKEDGIFISISNEKATMDNGKSEFIAK